MLIQTWTEVLVGSLQSLWIQLVAFLPSLIGSLIIFIIGLVFASGASSLIEKLVKAVKLDNFLRRVGAEEYTKRAKLELNSGYVLGQVAYWFLVLVFFSAAADVLKFYVLSGFIRDILNYLPNLIAAVLVMVIALIAANLIKKIVKASVMGARIEAAKLLAAISWWIIVIFGILIALNQLGVAVAIINTVITGLIAMGALAGGLAFGLGGKDHATRLLQKIEDEIKE
jgi:Mechanosensitive ion channel, conserved TM helix